MPTRTPPDPDGSPCEQHREDLQHVDPGRATRTVLQACQTLLANQVRLTTQLREHGYLSDGTATALLARADQTAAAIADDLRCPRDTSTTRPSSGVHDGTAPPTSRRRPT